MSKVFRKVKKFALPVAAAVIGNALLPGAGALGASLGSGVGTLASGGGIKNALLSGAGTFAGSSIGASLGGASKALPWAGGTAGKSIGQALGVQSAGALPWQGATNAIGQTALPWSTVGNIGSSTLGKSILNTNLGAALGGFAGSNIAQDAFAGTPKNTQSSSLPAAPAASSLATPFEPKREEEQDLPSGLSGLSSFTPKQQSSNLANRGTYGQGAGPEEQKYFLNQINRRLVDESGNVAADTKQLLPIELSYLKRLGLGGHSNTSNLLEAISKWKPA